MSRLITKPTKWHVRTAKTQISLGIHPDWSESLLCAQSVAKDPRILHVDSKDSGPSQIWVFARRKFILLILSWGGSNTLGSMAQRVRLKTHIYTHEHCTGKRDSKKSVPSSPVWWPHCWLEQKSRMWRKAHGKSPKNEQCQTPRLNHRKVQTIYTKSVTKFVSSERIIISFL